MTKKIVICLSKFGDICALLPLLQHECENGNPMALMVSKDYASVMEGQSIVETIVFDGGAHEIQRAYEHAKTLSNDVTCVQVAGPAAEVKKYTYELNGRKGEVTDSFAKEPWHILGKMDVWRKQPVLKFDKRDEKREWKLISESHDFLGDKKDKVILISLGGANSPFPFRPLLERMIYLQFEQQYQIIDISKIKCERVYDLLGLYERASCLIASDSAPLHLATAVPSLPVIALINDKPSLWNGSPWRANHVCHVRYSDFARRGTEILDAVQSAEERSLPRSSQSPNFIHVWSHYDLSSGYPEAKATWGGNRFRECAIEVGALGRDSHYSQVKDPVRYPFLKDALRLATFRAKEQDVLILTKSDTCLPEGIAEKIKAPCFAHRFEKGSYSPFVDLFAFTKEWWEAHREELPELIMGADVMWNQVLKALILKHGGTELPLGTVYRGENK